MTARLFTLERNANMNFSRHHRLSLLSNVDGMNRSPVRSLCCLWLTDAEADAVEASGLLGPAEDLPPGVHRVDGRLLLLPKHPLPKGWEWSGSSIWHRDTTNPRAVSGIWAVEVRPIPAPATEVIDTRLAKGRKLPDGQVITYVGDGPQGPWYAAPWRDINAATVEVQVES